MFSFLAGDGGNWDRACSQSAVRGRGTTGTGPVLSPLYEGGEAGRIGSVLSPLYEGGRRVGSGLFSVRCTREGGGSDRVRSQFAVREREADRIGSVLSSLSAGRGGWWDRPAVGPDS